MILHEISTRSTKSRHYDWWAVDSASLTLARCSIRNSYQLHVHTVRADVTPPEMSSVQDAATIAAGSTAILFSCRAHFKRPFNLSGVVSYIGANRLDIPEYILLGESGLPSAIMHTVDPVFIACYLDGRVSTPMGNLLAYRSNVDLPPAGWEYWTTDAYQEFERLSLEYSQCRLPALEGSP